MPALLGGLPSPRAPSPHDSGSTGAGLQTVQDVGAALAERLAAGVNLQAAASPTPPAAACTPPLSAPSLPQDVAQPPAAGECTAALT